MSEESESTEVEEDENADADPAPIKRKLGKWANIAAAVVAAVTAVLVSLGIWDREQSESITADADCLARCLAESDPIEEGDPEFMGPTGEAMLEAPVSDHDVEEAPVEEDDSNP